MSDASTEAEVRRVMETAQGFDLDLWRALSEMGVIGLITDEKFGGSGVGPMELEAVMEETGAALLCSPLLASGVIAAELLQALGDETLNASKSESGGLLVTTFTSSKRYSLVVFPPARQSNPPGKQAEDLTKTFNR